MAGQDEDVFQVLPSAHLPDADLTEEVQDFRFLSTVSQ